MAASRSTSSTATRMDAWKRTQLAPEVQNEFPGAVQKAEVPTGATTAVLRYVPRHSSSSCSSTHSGAVKPSTRARKILIRITPPTGKTQTGIILRPSTSTPPSSQVDAHESCVLMTESPKAVGESEWRSQEGC